MHFLIYIFDNNVGMFMDMVYMLTEAIKQHSTSHTHEVKVCSCVHHGKYNCTKHLQDDFNNDKQRLIVIGTGLSYHTIPKNSVITIFDCWDVMKERLMPLLPHHHICTYSQKDVDIMKQLNNKARVSYFEFGYATEHDKYRQQQKQIDACFIGCWSQRRQNILSDIQNHQVNVYYPNNQGDLYDDKREFVYNVSKVVLSIYRDEMLFGHTYASRIIPAVSNGAFVIAERSTSKEVNDFIGQFCLICDIEKLAETVKYYCTNDEARESLRAHYHQQIKEHLPKVDIQQFIDTTNLKSV
jgi:hypothetical protein